MIKAGLVGWLSTLPLGMAVVDDAFHGLGLAMLTAGLIAKWGTKKALDAAGEETLSVWLSLAAVGTTLLMARTLWRQWRQWPQHTPTAAKDRRLLAPMPLAWLISVLAALSLPLWFSWLAGGIEGVL
jgi:hypothetical protein